MRAGVTPLPDPADNTCTGAQRAWQVPMPKKTGRPSKLTPELQTQLCNFIARGHYPTTACAAVGLGEATYFRWMELGTDHLEGSGAARRRRPAKSPFKEFREAVEKAKAQAQMLAMEAIRDAAFEIVGPANAPQVKAKNWTAAAWYLERTAPQQFARREVLHTPTTPNPKDPGAKPAKRTVRFGGRFKPDGTLQTSAPSGSAKSPSSADGSSTPDA
jgi:hypothetical protein